MKCEKCGSVDHATDKCTVEVATAPTPNVSIAGKDLTGMLVDIRESVRSYEVDTAELLQVQAKATEALTTEFTAHKTLLEGMEATINEMKTDMDKESEKKALEFWDGMVTNVKNQKLAAAWGYGEAGWSPIGRSMYTPNYKSLGGGRVVAEYDLPDQIMKMNDFLHLWGMKKAFETSGSMNIEAKAYREEIMGCETYQILKSELASFDKSFSKALDTETANEGLEWIPTQFSAQFIEDFRLLLKVSALFPSINIPLGTGDFKVPNQGGRQLPFLQGQAKSDNASDYNALTPGTGNKTFSPIKHAAIIYFSDEMQEDAAVAILPIVLQTLQQSIADGMETALINGDTTATHQDSDVTSADDVRKSFQGLRHYAGGASGQAAVDLSTISVENFRKIRKGMGRYGIIPTDLANLMSISAYIQALSIEEVETVEKFGLEATVKSGILGVMDGSPIVVSEFIRQDLNTSGVYDGATVTDTITLTVNTRAFWVANKGPIRSETARDPKKGQSYSVISHRFDFKQTQTPDTSIEQTVGLGYSITS